MSTASVAKRSIKVHISPVWSKRGFFRLWTAQAISETGSQLTGVALPLIAVLQLNATPFQVGILNAMSVAPFLLIGLFAGVWVDRVKRRPILILADFGRALLLALIPLAAVLSQLHWAVLFIVTLLVGILTVFYEVALPSFLPSLVGTDLLLEGNSSVEGSQAIAKVAGPGLGGLLVQFITAPFAIAFDALSFILSGILTVTIQVNETSQIRRQRLARQRRHSLVQDIAEGFRTILGNRRLRWLMASVCTVNLFDGMINAIIVIYITRQLGFRPWLWGLVVASGSVGSVIASLTASRISHRFGTASSLIAATIVIGIGRILIPVSQGTMTVLVPLVTVAYFLTGFGFVLHAVNLRSLTQSVVPMKALGRTFATQRFLAWGIFTIGLVLGGISAEYMSLRLLFLICAFGIIVATTWLIFTTHQEVKGGKRRGKRRQHSVQHA